MRPARAHSPLSLIADPRLTRPRSPRPPPLSDARVAYKFTVVGDSDTQEVELSDEAVMESIKAEDEALAAKVAAPEEIRLGYYI